MKKSYKIFALALFSFLIVHCTFNIDNCSAQWVQMTNGIGSASIGDLAYSGNNIYAGAYSASYKGVCLSTNYGTNWTQTALNNISVMSLAISGINIFVGAEDWPEGVGGVYLSTNNGANWSSNLFAPIQNVWDVLVNGNTIIAGVENYYTAASSGVYLSTNNGTNWIQTLNNDFINALAVSGTNIFAGGGNGVYKSTNNGINWTLTSLQFNIGAFAVSGNNIFAGTWVSGTAQGVYLSTNNGANWTQTSLNNRNINSMAVSGNNVFAGTYGYGFYVSTNNGSNWTQRNEGFVGTTYVFSLCVLNNYIFAGTSDYVFRRQLSEIITGITPVSGQVPSHYALEQNYPNPFNPVTKIKFEIAAHSVGQTFLSVYDLLGREVAILVNEQLNPGTYEVEWNAQNYTSGVYFYRLQSGEFVDTKKLVLLK